MPARTKYRWDEWFRRGRMALLLGTHYECSQSSIVAMVRNAASKRGLSVCVQDRGDHVIVEVTGESPHPDKTPVAV